MPVHTGLPRTFTLSSSEILEALEVFRLKKNLRVLRLPDDGIAAQAAELARRWAPAILQGWEKESKHTALADVHESIEELRRYRAAFLRLPEG